MVSGVGIASHHLELGNFIFMDNLKQWTQNVFNYKFILVFEIWKTRNKAVFEDQNPNVLINNSRALAM